MILLDDSDDYSEVSGGDFSSEPAMKVSGEYYQNLPINLPPTQAFRRIFQRARFLGFFCAF